MTLNIECLSAKFDKLCAFIQVLSNSNVHFSAIAIQETWLSENCNYALYDIPGYNSIYQGYHCGRKGGLIIYVLECIFVATNFFGSIIMSTHFPTV